MRVLILQADEPEQSRTPLQCVKFTATAPQRAPVRRPVLVHCKIGKRARSPIEFSSVCPASALIRVIQSISGPFFCVKGPSPELPDLPWLNGDLTTRQARRAFPHESEPRCLGRGRRVAAVGAVETAPFRVDERPTAGNPAAAHVPRRARASSRRRASCSI